MLLLPDTLRQWADTGLDFILAPGRGTVLAPKVQARPAGQRGQQRAPQQRAAQQQGGQQYGTRQAPPQQQGQQPQPAQSAPSGQRPAPSQQASVPPLPRKQQAGWTAPWDHYRTKVLNVPCRDLWTYFDLSLDLGETPNDDRRALLGKMLGLFPKGTASFWPCSEPKGHGLMARPDLFWRGAREFQARNIFIFGERAARALFPAKRLTYGIHTEFNFTIAILPGFGPMIEGNQQAKAAAWQLMKKFSPSK